MLWEFKSYSWPKFQPWSIERHKQNRADAVIPVMDPDLVGREAHCVPRCSFPRAADGFTALVDVIQDGERLIEMLKVSYATLCPDPINSHGADASGA